MTRRSRSKSRHLPRCPRCGVAQRRLWSHLRAAHNVRPNNRAWRGERAKNSGRRRQVADDVVADTPLSGKVPEGFLRRVLAGLGI